MLASAVLLIGQSASPVFTVDLPTENTASIPGFPLACHDVLGESVIERTVMCLRNAGINLISVGASSYLSDFVKALSRKYRNIEFVHLPPVYALCVVFIVYEMSYKIANTRMGSTCRPRS